MVRYKCSVRAVLLSMLIASVAFPLPAAENVESGRDKFTPSFHVPPGFVQESSPVEDAGPYTKKQLGQYARPDTKSATTTIIRHSRFSPAVMRDLGRTPREMIQLLSMAPDKDHVQIKRESIAGYAGPAAERMIIEVGGRVQAGAQTFLVYFKVQDPVPGSALYAMDCYYESSGNVYNIAIFKHVPSSERSKVSDADTRKEFAKLMQQSLLGEK